MIEILKAYIKWIFSKKTPNEKARLDICFSCDKRKYFVCSECGCVIYAKVRSKYDCPLKKWKL